MSNERIGREAAEEFRDQFQLGVEPISSLARLIEQKVSVGVAYVEAPTPGHGMTMRHGTRHLIAVGCTEHPMRLRSTLAHELGHLRLGTVDRDLNHSAWDKRTPEEIQADSFARHLLVPLDAVRAASQKTDPSTALLSDLVQTYMASPSIVAIQLREAQVIDTNTYQEWSALTTGQLAFQFGWHTEYVSLASQSMTPRAPQSLLARAVEGYRWGLVTAAAIARLDGKHDQRLVSKQLQAEGIVPLSFYDTPPQRPPQSGIPLTEDEIRLLLSDSE